MNSIEIIRALNKANHQRYLENRRRKTGDILDELQRFLSPHIAKLDEVTEKVDQNLRQLEANCSDLLNDFSEISQRFTEKLERVFEIKR